MKKLFLISGVSALICLGVYAGSNDQSGTTVTIARSCLGNVGENTKVCVKDKDSNGSSCQDIKTNAQKDCYATWVQTITTTVDTSIIP